MWLRPDKIYQVFVCKKKDNARRRGSSLVLCLDVGWWAMGGDYLARWAQNKKLELGSNWMSS